MLYRLRCAITLNALPLCFLLHRAGSWNFVHTKLRASGFVPTACGLGRHGVPLLVGCVHVTPSWVEPRFISSFGVTGVIGCALRQCLRLRQNRRHRSQRRAELE